MPRALLARSARAVALALLAALAIAPAPARSAGSSTPSTETVRMDTIAERYVKLVLALGEHDADYVDAYYGPAAWRDAARQGKAPLPVLKAQATELLAELARQPVPGDELGQLRHSYVQRQLEALRARVDMLTGTKLSFDEESKALYDAVAPTHTESDFQATLRELERALPGEGPLSARVESFRKGFQIPPARLDAVFKAAIAECRRRTLAHVDLPKDERFDLEYVTGKPWSGYNWYKGDFKSLIQVNTDLPTTIDRALDLACHEGYPGHHVYNVLLEQQLVKAKGFVEFTVYPLFSPQSLIAEGTANYGIDVAFPGRERVEFEMRVLYPLAGLDGAQAERYYSVLQSTERLSYAGNEAARRYLEGRLDAAGTQRWLETYALSSPARAKQRLAFFDAYRSYVINYNLGKDLVRQFIERRGGTADQPARRWDEFKRLLASPRLPGGLR
jgi:hypothetical protein